MNQGDDIREEIRDRIRIEAVIGNYVALRPSGRRFKGLCPFHAEKTPSFNVDPERQMWRCFGCLGCRNSCFVVGASSSSPEVSDSGRAAAAPRRSSSIGTARPGRFPAR